MKTVDSVVERQPQLMSDHEHEILEALLMSLI